MIKETLRNWKNVNIFSKQTLGIFSSYPTHHETLRLEFAFITKRYFQISFCKILKMKEVPQWCTAYSFHFNGHTLGFQSAQLNISFGLKTLNGYTLGCIQQLKS